MRVSITITIGAAIAILGASSIGFVKFQHKRLMRRLEDTSYSIRRIIQTGPQKQALKTSYLAELLDLSSDRHVPLELFSIQDGTKMLLESRVVKQARIERRKPDTLYIDYSVREPLCILLDFENTAIDDEGKLFPLTPFFSPKNLPELYFNIDAPSVPEEKLEMAFDLLSVFANLREQPFRLKRIDLSLLDEESLGRRELVIQLQYPGEYLHTLRFNPLTVNQQLANYVGLIPDLEKKNLIVDLRLDDQAFLSEAM